jgi:choline-sulfatase
MTPIRFPLAPLLCVALATFGAGCSRKEGDVPARSGSAAAKAENPAPHRLTFRPNLLLVTLDTVRFDHLGCYGNKGVETPGLDRLAREGLLVEQAVAVAPLTLPSHASILTGLYPPRHGVRDNSDFRLPAAVTTLAEHLKSQGYATEAVVGSVVLSSSLGLEQGFDRYDEPAAIPRETAPRGHALFRPVLERPAAAVTDAAIVALDQTGEKPFFLWVHYYDPHQPYAPPEPYARRFSGRPYDGEIAYVDAQLGRLVDELSKRGLLDRTLVVVTADHGESLGDHGEETHGLFVYDATIHVPLLLRFPGSIPEGRRVDRVASGVDIVPTALDLMELPPLPGVQGVSFARAARGEAQGPRDAAYAEAVYAERVYGWAPTFCLRDAGTKFIEAPETELYALGTDPREERNLAPSRADDVKQWKGRFDAATAAIGTPDASAESPMDAEARERLASLGYLSGSSGAIQRSSRPDPKRLVGVNQQLVHATTLISQGRSAEALAVLTEALAADPENPAVLTLAGTLAFNSGKKEQAISQLQSAARLAPSVYDNQWNLANALHLSRRLPEAATAYRAALAVRPLSSEARYGLGTVLIAMNDAPGAVETYNEALRLGQRAAKVRAGLGIALAATGDTARAMASLREAVDEDPSLVVAWNKIGILTAQRGKTNEALGFFAKALAAEPDNPDALSNHARASMLLGDLETARRDVEHLARKQPNFPTAWSLRAQILEASGDKEGAQAVVREFLKNSQGADPRTVQSAQEMLKKLGG